MPKPKKVLNAFTADEVTSITKLSRPMVDYLATKGFLRPAYVDETVGRARPRRARGRVRYYSFRDLVIARVVQSLRETGVRLHRLKLAINRLNEHPDWADAPDDPTAKIRWLLSDGKNVLIKHHDGFLEEIASGQRAFAFVVNLDQVEREVRQKVPVKRRPYCSLTNTTLLLDPHGSKQALLSR
jgi:DNA-binding transcriptional MerR regulator